MYKNENTMFGQICMQLGVLQQQCLQNYIQEHPEHTVLLSQWLLQKRHLNATQIQNIIKYYTQKTGKAYPEQIITDETSHKSQTAIGQQNTISITRERISNDETSHKFQTTIGHNVPKQKPQEIINIGRYRVISVLGQGGMGKVYKVFDPVHQKELALKVLLVGDEASEQAIRRFQREAKTMIKLNHPGIVKAYDIGQENNQVFFTMDLVKGCSLKELQNINPLSIEQSVKIIIEVCKIMSYTHKEGIIHRDLKPANIMVDNGKPIIMDFGLAKVSEASMKLSRTGVMMGTLRYMAPEQAEGQHSDITAQTDLYSIGAILYELLAQREIFEVTSYLMMINYILTKPPIPLTEVNPDIPISLENICSKALAKKPQQRYKDCLALAEDLEKFLKNPNSSQKIKISPKTKTTMRIKTKTKARNRSSSNNKTIVIVSVALSVLVLVLFITNSPTKNNVQNQLTDKSQIQNSNEQTKVNPSNNEVKQTDKPEKDKPQESSKTEKSTKADEQKQSAPNNELGEQLHETVIAEIHFQHRIISKNINILPESKDVGIHPDRGNLLVFFAGDRSQLNISFYLEKIPQKLFLRPRHLASSANGINHSVITIIVNNKVLRSDYDVTIKGSPKEEKFEITDNVQSGQNTISIIFSRKSTSHYWLYNLDIIAN